MRNWRNITMEEERRKGYEGIRQKVKKPKNEP